MFRSACLFICFLFVGFVVDGGVFVVVYLNGLPFGFSCCVRDQQLGIGRHRMRLNIRA